MLTGDLKALLKSKFGHDSFMPLQEEVIRNVLAGQDSLVLMPTGSGKSLCYQLPALCLDGVTLVISPLIALMKDQVDSLQSRGIAADCINSAMGTKHAKRVQKAAYEGRIDILYVAPERVVTRQFLDFLHALKLSLIAIDEAHCISEWGHEFRPEYRELQVLRDNFPAVPVIALTATATERVRQDIVDQLRMPNAGWFVTSFNRPNLTYRVFRKQQFREDLDLDALVKLLRRNNDGSAIVYRNKRVDTEALAADLAEHDFKALPYHAGLEDDVRRETQELFIRGDVPVIVATIAFGMGVDKQNVRLVAHYDLPKSVEGYYQQTGRAGRDGKPSECMLFYSIEDTEIHDYFNGFIEDATQRKNAEARLEEMIEYAELQTCRRAFLLDYFGEEWQEDNCGACDVCLAESKRTDAADTHVGTPVAQQATSAVRGTTDLPSDSRAGEPAKEDLNQERMRKTFPRAYEPWAHEEDHQLASLYAAGWSISKIASKLGRTPGAIESRLNSGPHLERVRQTPPSARARIDLAANSRSTCEKPGCSLNARRGSATCWLHTWKLCKEPNCTRKFRLPDEGTHVYCRTHFENMKAHAREESRAKGLCTCGAACPHSYESCLDCHRSSYEYKIEYERALEENVPHLDAIGIFNLTISYRIHKIEELTEAEWDVLLPASGERKPKMDNRLRFHAKGFLTPYRSYSSSTAEGEIEGWLNEELANGYVLQDYEALSTAWGEYVLAMTKNELTGKRVQIQGNVEVERDWLTDGE